MLKLNIFRYTAMIMGFPTSSSKGKLIAGDHFQKLKVILIDNSFMDFPEKIYNLCEKRNIASIQSNEEKPCLRKRFSHWIRHLDHSKR
ncbi:hypothetical protein PR048_013501 [Dryococelus australis]|uniref:Uncharacterized protein n=1 Tax=Dryococelus australis TaxID=614101 RepID=A0ABQ9HT74_9NEOP|nr:hypothetical protein PR048_013501 [Dryococelus australis]